MQQRGICVQDPAMRKEKARLGSILSDPFNLWMVSLFTPRPVTSDAGGVKTFQAVAHSTFNLQVFSNGALSVRSSESVQVGLADLFPPWPHSMASQDLKVLFSAPTVGNVIQRE